MTNPFLFAIDARLEAGSIPIALNPNFSNGSSNIPSFEPISTTEFAFGKDSLSLCANSLKWFLSPPDIDDAYA